MALLHLALVSLDPSYGSTSIDKPPKVTPLPLKQMTVLGLIQLSESMAIAQLLPYVAFMMQVIPNTLNPFVNMGWKPGSSFKKRNFVTERLPKRYVTTRTFLPWNGSHVTQRILSRYELWVTCNPTQYERVNALGYFFPRTVSKVGSSLGLRGMKIHAKVCTFINEQLRIWLLNLAAIVK